MGKDNPFAAREFQKFAADFRKRTLPKIKQSAHMMVIGPVAGTFEIEMATQIGAAILLDKPLVVVAPKGRAVGEKLKRIADHVIEADMETEAGREEAMARLRAWLNQ